MYSDVHLLSKRSEFDISIHLFLLYNSLSVKENQIMYAMYIVGRFSSQVPDVDDLFFNDFFSK